MYEGICVRQLPQGAEAFGRLIGVLKKLGGIMSDKPVKDTPKASPTDAEDGDKSIPRRSVLKGAVGGLVAGVGAASAARADTKDNPQPRIQKPRTSEPNPTLRAPTVKARAHTVPRRTVKLGRARGIKLNSHVESLLRDDLQIDPERVKSTVALFQDVLKNMAPQRTGLINMRFGAGPGGPGQPGGVDGWECGANICKAQICSYNDCGAQVCSGQGCDGNSCGTQSCGANGCDSNTCGANQCSGEGGSDIVEEWAQSGWAQIKVLEEMHDRLGSLYVEIEHYDVARLTRFSFD